MWCAPCAGLPAEHSCVPTVRLLADGSRSRVPGQDRGWREQGPGPAGSRSGRQRWCRRTGRAANERTWRACRRTRAAGPPWPDLSARGLTASAAASMRSVAAPGGEFPRPCFTCRAPPKRLRMSFSFPRHRHEVRSIWAMPARPAGQEPIASRPDPSNATLWSAPSLPTSTVGGVRSTSSS